MAFFLISCGKSGSVREAGGCGLLHLHNAPSVKSQDPKAKCQLFDGLTPVMKRGASGAAPAGEHAAMRTHARDAEGVLRNKRDGAAG